MAWLEPSTSYWLPQLYFIFLGGLNAYFGLYIAVFNIAIAFMAITGHSSTGANPFVWVNILDLAGIQNVYIQWGIVLISAVLGLTEKGVDIFDG